jgi:hypothetical protein
MCKKTNSSVNGTSFHDVTILANVQDLIKALGEPTIQDNTGEDKVNFEWDCETEEGDVFTIYDWKEYREINDIEVIEWHIGAHSKSVSNVAKMEIQKQLNDLFN